VRTWRPAAPHGEIQFAVEPPGAALLIAALEGLDVAADRYSEAAAYAYDDTQSFLAEFP